MAQKRLTDIPDPYDARTFRRFSQDIDARFRALEASVSVYTVTNFTPTRTLDMATAGAPQIGNFLATLVSDLQSAGRLGK
jgi:hypothetical protein